MHMNRLAEMDKEIMCLVLLVGLIGSTPLCAEG